MIAKRITSILKHYQLTAQGFADKIGMQRSTLSHIFLGRNKPSLDMLTKISDAFPEVSMDYIIAGEGELLKPDKSPSLFSQTAVSESNSTSVTSVMDTQSSVSVTPVTDNTLAATSPKIVRVIEIYDDGTFKEYNK